MTWSHILWATGLKHCTNWSHVPGLAGLEPQNVPKWKVSFETFLCRGTFCGSTPALVADNCSMIGRCRTTKCSQMKSVSLGIGKRHFVVGEMTPNSKCPQIAAVAVCLWWTCYSKVIMVFRAHNITSFDIKSVRISYLSAHDSSFLLYCTELLRASAPSSPPSPLEAFCLSTHYLHTLLTGIQRNMQCTTTAILLCS